MSLLQITEPGQSLDPHQRKRAAGIDLGTTNSLIATARGAITDTLPDAHGEHGGLERRRFGNRCVGSRRVAHDVGSPARVP